MRKNFIIIMSVVLSIIIVCGMLFCLAPDAFESNDSADTVTALESGYENILFSNGYRGYCVDQSWSGAYTGGQFTISENTSIVTNNVTNEDVSQQIKVLFTQCFDSIFVPDGNGGYHIEGTLANTVLGVIYGFTDNRYVWGEQLKLMNAVNEYSGPAIPDDGYQLTLDTGEVITFHFLVFCPTVDRAQYFFAYRIDVTPKDSHTHNWGDEWIADDDQHWHECECGDKNDVAAHNKHTVDEKTNDCVNAGYTGDVVCECGKIITAGVVIPSLGHNMGEWYITIQPTCSEKGEEKRDCSRCEYSEIHPIDMIEHTFSKDLAVAPTCTKDGLTSGSHCTVCGYVSLKQEVIPALGHDMCEWYVTIEPACDKDGEEQSDCSRCEYFNTRSLIMTGHTDVVDKAVPATCTENGLTEGKHCDACGYVSLRQEVVPALGHNMGSWYITIQPTCIKDGEEQSDCSRCEHFETRSIYMLGHNSVKDKPVAPTCVKNGLTEGKHCDRCDMIIDEQKIVPALGHNVIIDNSVMPTCTNTGLTKGEHCDRCGEIFVKQDVVDSLGHIEVIDEEVAPTCIDAGLSDGKHCSRCEAILKPQTEVKPLGHNVVIDEGKTPTCLCVGYTDGKHCDRCNEVLVQPEVLFALGHNMGDWYITIYPTFTSDGEERSDCQRETCEHYETSVLKMIGSGDEIIPPSSYPEPPKTGDMESHSTIYLFIAVIAYFGFAILFYKKFKP